MRFRCCHPLQSYYSNRNSRADLFDPEKIATSTGCRSWLNIAYHITDRTYDGRIQTLAGPQNADGNGEARNRHLSEESTSGRSKESNTGIKSATGIGLAVHRELPV